MSSAEAKECASGKMQRGGCRDYRIRYQESRAQWGMHVGFEAVAAKCRW